MLTEYDLPLPELLAARLDGDVYSVGDAFAPIDECEQPHHRARSIAVTVSPRLIAERATAAWIHGARPTPPAVHQVCTSYFARTRPAHERPLVLREVVIGPDEVESIGGIAVTTVLRTAIDLSRTEAGFERETVLSLLTMAGLEPQGVLDAVLSRPKLAGKRRAVARLEALAEGRGVRL